MELSTFNFIRFFFLVLPPILRAAIKVMYRYQDITRCLRKRDWITVVLSASFYGFGCREQVLRRDLCGRTGRPQRKQTSAEHFCRSGIGNRQYSRALTLLPAELCAHRCCTGSSIPGPSSCSCSRHAARTARAPGRSAKGEGRTDCDKVEK